MEDINRESIKYINKNRKKSSSSDMNKYTEEEEEEIIEDDNSSSYNNNDNRDNFNNNNDDIDINFNILNNLVNNEISKRALKLLPKITKFLLRKIIYIVFGTTLIYNFCWIINIVLKLNEIEHIYFSLNKDIDLDEYKIYTSSLRKSGNTIIIYAVMLLIFSFIILLIPRLCAHNEADCSMVCVLLRNVITWFFSVYQYFNTPDYGSYKNKFSYTKILKKFLYSIELYFYFEKLYVYSGLAFTLLIVAGIGLVVLKEIWKGRGYHGK